MFDHSDVLSSSDYLFMLIWLIFPVIGMVAAVRAVRLVAGAARYERSLLTMHSVPAAIGGQLDGVIRAPGLRLRENQRVRLTLKCRVSQTRQGYTEASGRPGGQQVVETVEWKNAWIVPRSEVAVVEGAALIPVELAIPSSLRGTGKVMTKTPGRTDNISWWVVARAEPHHLWTASFEVPVFRTSESVAPERSA